MAAKTYFDPISPKADFPELEERVIKYWKKNRIFEKSVETRSKEKVWNFLDGPPFITGLPHYGSLLSSIPKDIFPRYKTLKGYRVRRVWGWDCHGLPAENKVENKLGLKSKREIEEKVGVKKFIEECKLYVSETSSEWEWYVDHIGRWVDFKNAYKTMDKTYMESVMWVFKKMYDKGFIYKGLRVSLYCPHCQTPISNFEVAMDADNYKEVGEHATTYKYPVLGQKNTFLLAWSTTPWNKIATPALAVNPKLTYVKVSQGDEFYILAKSTASVLNGKGKFKVIETFTGKKLLGLKFTPHYDYYKGSVQKGQKAFEVFGGDFVTDNEGTGIVTIAAYGEDDLKLMQRENIYIELHVGDDGVVKNHVPNFGGMHYLKTNDLVDEDLMERGLVYKKDPITHSVAHCWRCGTRLFHNPQIAWYVDVQRLKPKVKKTNRNVNWVPAHFKFGRYLKSLEAAPDWCISRSRYWGSPVPVWECTSCDEKFVPGSIEELEKASGQKINDLHKPEIDKITVKCKRCAGVAKRVSEVLDSWIEAGSASFAERHFPFEKGHDEKNPWNFFPPDFVVEYTGQIRAWFYVLHVITSALYDSEAYKNVLVTGVILGTDGRKMSKNYGNYPDPKMMLTTYGGDALRLYLMGSPVMKGEDILISEDHYRNQVKNFLLPLWNVYNFFVTYSNLSGWKPTDVKLSTRNVLDKWILFKLGDTLSRLERAYESFDTQEVVKLCQEFLVNDLSGWYVRRSRERFWLGWDYVDKSYAQSVLWTVLKSFVQALSPLAPFITEEIHRNLTKEESVHLSDWPETKRLNITGKKTLDEMKIIRDVVEEGHALRKEAKIPVRQPLSSIKVVLKDPAPQADVLELLKEELNIRNVYWSNGLKQSINLDTTITPELEEEGRTRELIRKVQQERKKLSIKLDQNIDLFAPWFPESKKNIQILKKRTLARKYSKGNFRVVPL